MLNKPRLVVDTNVLISRALQGDSLPARAVTHAIKEYQLLLSSDTLEELNSVLSRPKFERYITSAGRSELLVSLLRVGLYLHHVAPVQACRDPKDDKFLALAVAGEARMILTGDRDLLDLHPFRGIEIVSPEQFLSRARQRG